MEPPRRKSTYSEPFLPLSESKERALRHNVRVPTRNTTIAVLCILFIIFVIIYFCGNLGYTSGLAHATERVVLAQKVIGAVQAEITRVVSEGMASAKAHRLAHIARYTAVLSGLFWFSWVTAGLVATASNPVFWLVLLPGPIAIMADDVSRFRSASSSGASDAHALPENNLTNLRGILHAEVNTLIEIKASYSFLPTLAVFLACSTLFVACFLILLIVARSLFIYTGGGAIALSATAPVNRSFLVRVWVDVPLRLLAATNFNNINNNMGWLFGGFLAIFLSAVLCIFAFCGCYTVGCYAAVEALITEPLPSAELLYNRAISGVSHPTISPREPSHKLYYDFLQSWFDVGYGVVVVNFYTAAGGRNIWLPTFIFSVVGSLHLIKAGAIIHYVSEALVSDFYGYNDLAIVSKQCFPSLEAEITARIIEPYVDLLFFGAVAATLLLWLVVRFFIWGAARHDPG